MLVRFVHLVAVGVAIALAAELIRAVARVTGGNLAFRYDNVAGVLTVYALAVLGALAFVRVVWGISLREAVAQHWRYRQRVALGFLVAALLATVALLLAWAVVAWVGVATWHSSRWQRLGWSMAGRTLLALGSLVLVAAVEECIFRGAAFGYLRGDRARQRAAGAILGSAVIFALSHHLHAPAKWLAPSGPALFVGLALLGVLLAVTYEVTGSLACATGVHAGLLLAEVFARNRGTRLVLVSPSGWWIGTEGDLRTAPLAWMLFLALTLIVWWAGPALRPLVAVPPEHHASVAPR